MPVAHYKIDFSLLVLRTCSIFACQWGLRRGEMRLKLLLIDVVDSLASFTLHCLQQVSERSSNHAGGFLQRSPTHPFLSPSDLPCSVPPSEKTDQLWCRALPSEAKGHRGMSVLFTDRYPHTVRPFALGWTGLAGDSVQEIPELFASGPQHNQSPEATHVKNSEEAQLMRSL